MLVDWGRKNRFGESDWLIRELEVLRILDPVSLVLRGVPLQGHTHLSHPPLSWKGNEILVQKQPEEKVVNVLQLFRSAQVQHQDTCLRLCPGWTDRQTDRQTGRQTDRQRQTHRQIRDRQRDKQRDRQG